jgi:uncharacterized damage-inducible protein DinB
MKKIFFHLFPSTIWIIILTILSLSVESQSLTGEDIRTQFLKDWERAKSYTLEYLQAVPAEKYSFRPTDSVRSFAQQMLHLASSNIFLMGTATDNKIDWPGTDHEGKMINQSKDSVIYYVTKSYNFSIESIKAFDMSKLLEVVGPARIRATRFAYLLKSFEHQTHTLGQTTIYIRLLGLKPPSEKLF